MLKFWLLPLIFLTLSSAQAKPQENFFYDLIHHQLPSAHIGIQVQTASDGKIVFQHQPFATFHPASTTKLITSFAALKLLGKEYQFKTQIRHQPPTHGSVEQLTIEFLGDPTLTVESYQEMIRYLKQQNINKINGDLILDNHVFSDHPYAPGWTWDDLNFGYAPPIDGISLAQNQVQVKLSSAQALNQSAQAESVGTLKAKFTSSLATVTEAQAQSCSFEVAQEAEHFTLHGCWPMLAEGVTLSLANRDLHNHLKSLLSELLSQHGIELVGTIRFGTSDLPVAKVFYSQPLTDLVEIILKDSNNFYAESLLKVIGLELKGQGTFHHGLLAINQFLQEEVGLNPHEFVLRDGSGLSQYNLISANQLSRLLYVIFHDDLYPTFKSSLAHSGTDGTLSSRLKAFDIQGRFNAKTGTLSGHSALSGFLEQDHQTLIVTLLINNSVHSKGRIKALEDQVILWIQQNRFG